MLAATTQKTFAIAPPARYTRRGHSTSRKRLKKGCFLAAGIYALFRLGLWRVQKPLLGRFSSDQWSEGSGQWSVGSGRRVGHFSGQYGRRRNTIHYPLPTIHYPLSTTHYPLPTIRYPLPTIRYPLISRGRGKGTVPCDQNDGCPVNGSGFIPATLARRPMNRSADAIQRVRKSRPPKQQLAA